MNSDSNPPLSKKLRILVVDDEEEILDLFKIVLSGNDVQATSDCRRENLEGELFGNKGAGTLTQQYDLSLCRQGDEAIEMVKAAERDDDPFAIAFLDIRMPPGPDGIWTAEQIRRIDPFVNLVIVTAYADVDPSDISLLVPPADKLLYLQKPLHYQEIRQFALALGSKWHSEKSLALLNSELEERIRLRTFDLVQANTELENEIEGRIRVEEALRQTDSELVIRTQDLEESNIALKVLLKQRDRDKERLAEQLKEVEEKMLFNVKDVTIPFIDKLCATQLNEQQREYLDVLKNNLNDIVSPLLHRMTGDKINFTPSEIHIANLITQGKTTKEIASVLNLGVRTVEFHRANIRKKLKISNEGDNLKSVLLSIR